MLPIDSPLLETLHQIPGSIQTTTVDQESCEAISRVVNNCRERAEKLHTIFESTRLNDETRGLERRKAKFRILTHSNNVASLMRGIAEDIQYLTISQITKPGVEAQVAEALNILKQLKLSPPSTDVLNTNDTERDTLLKNLEWDDPRDDLHRIRGVKGGLDRDVSRWILTHPGYLEWKTGTSKPLWIKGDAGKGKTMLLITLVEQFQSSSKLATHSPDNQSAFDETLSFFFCQNTDPRLNDAVAILKGLIYLLMLQDSSMISFIKHEYARKGKEFFDSSSNANAFHALSRIFQDMVQSFTQGTVYLVVDALDECETERDDLLQLIMDTSQQNSCLKWIVTSRNTVVIDETLTLSLEVNSEAVRNSIEIYIHHKIMRIPSLQPNPELKAIVEKELLDKAGGTFLWVDLVFQSVRDVLAKDIIGLIQKMPEGLPALYGRMMEVMMSRTDTRDACLRTLSIVTAAYRPLHILELRTLAGFSCDDLDLKRIVELCGSFLTLLDHRIYLIHQSANDYLVSEEALDTIFPSGKKAPSNHGTLVRQIEDAYRFILHSRAFIEKSPLQTYVSALIFAPANCVIRKLFKSEEPSWISPKPIVEQGWSPCLQTMVGHAGEVPSVAFSIDGTRIISGSDDTTIRVWDARSGQQMQKLEGHGGSVTSVAFSPDGTRIISGSNDKSIRIWDAKSGQQMQKLEGHGRSVTSVAFSPDGTRIISGSDDETIRIWDTKSGQQMQKLEGYGGSVTSVAFSPDGTRIISGSDDKMIRIWDAKSGQQMQKLQGHDWRVRSVAFSPDGTRIISGSGDETIRIWDAKSGQQMQKLEGHGRSVTSVAFSPNGTRIISGSGDETIRIWDAKSGQQMQKLEGHSDWVGSVAFSPDGTRIISGSADETIRIWDAKSGQQMQKLEGHGGEVTSVAFSPDGTRIISSSAEETIRIWDAKSGQQMQKLKGHSDWVRSVAFSPDGTRIISGSDDETIRIWDAKSGQQMQKLEGHSDWVRSVAFSPDGTRIISGSDDETIRIWDAKSGQQMQKLEGHSDWVRSVAFSPDGTRIISGSDDETIRIWDAKSGQQMHKLEGHTLLEYIRFE
ncbi:unnamed protein product [Parascedosporium putredinis]|uniref:NACHT domain-containing protein n=1 Tax=Parascedosporium putredinis TaxID=1442378 RepID=A0A9P1GXE0_9PEZI|nr:unnamed protein product [Parascedosporium putredinis]CAI7988942.1 unnamed protein product [Parascedosporium putredinis]